MCFEYWYTQFHVLERPRLLLDLVLDYSNAAPAYIVMPPIGYKNTDQVSSMLGLV